MSKKRLVLLFVFAAVWLAAILVIFLNLSKSPKHLQNIAKPNLPKKEEILYEKIPGSKFHSPDATWWGYNQSKIVRYKDLVFTYFIDNIDNSNKTLSNFVVLKKQGDKSWKQGASFPTSRPGNLLIDSIGILHAFIFEPTNVTANDSIGKLKHYYFPDAAIGDITKYIEETVVDNDGTSETANIRVGSAIGKDDTMAVSFGLTKFNPLYKGQSEHMYIKKPSDRTWRHLIIGENLGHDFFYPFTLVSDNSFYLLPIQDDFAGPGNPNIYQKIMYFAYETGMWNKEIIAELTSHILAKTRPRLLEQEDLFKDNKEQIHILYKQFIDPQTTWRATHVHVAGTFGNWQVQEIGLGNNDINWIRLIEVDEKLYYILSSFDSLYISPVGSKKLTNISIPADAKGMYLYTATSKSGTKESEYIDVLLLGADQKLFHEGKATNYYIRIPKSVFINL